MVSRFEAAPSIANDVVRQWLDRVQFHAYDQAWLTMQADRIAQILWAALNRGEFSLEATNTLITIAPHMLTHHDVDGWVQLLFTALGGAYNIHDDELQGRLYAIMGQGHTLQGSVKQARTTYELAIGHAEDYITDRLLAEEIELMAYIGLFRTQTYLYTDQFSPERVTEVCALARKIDDPMLTANLYQALAGAYAHRADLERALGYGMTALGYWYQRGRPLEIARAAHTLAMAYSRQSLLVQAEQAVEIACRHVERAGNDQYTAIIGYERGIIASQQAKWEQAENWLRIARAGFAALGWDQHKAMVDRSIALTYIPQHRYGEAETHLNEAASIWARNENWYERAGVMATRGYLEAERGNSDTALRHYEEALVLCKQIPEMAARDLLYDSIIADLGNYIGSTSTSWQENDPE